MAASPRAKTLRGGNIITRHLVGYSRKLGTAASRMAQRQETQIVQSQLDLDGFLRALWKGAPS